MEGRKLVLFSLFGAAGFLFARMFRQYHTNSSDVGCKLYAAAKSVHLPVELKLPERFSLVSAAPDSGTEKGFRVGKFLSILQTNVYGTCVYYAPCMPSTHTFLSENVRLVPVGTLCIADVQSQGKGRAGNAWTSPKGCLMFSFTLEMENGKMVPFLQYVVCLAVVCGIEAICSAKKVPVPKVRIKWPNDIYADNLKIGGVLCTSTYSAAKTFHIVAGVGLNVDNDKPTTCLNSLISSLDPNAAPVEKEELLAVVLERFEQLFNTFQMEGFSPLENLYYERWLHSGQKVVIEENSTSDTSVQTPVVIEGLTSSGFLLASDESGARYELHPDGNSLDFFKGLVKRKLEKSA